MLLNSDFFLQIEFSLFFMPGKLTKFIVSQKNGFTYNNEILKLYTHVHKQKERNIFFFWHSSQTRMKNHLKLFNKSSSNILGVVHKNKFNENDDTIDSFGMAKHHVIMASWSYKHSNLDHANSFKKRTFGAFFSNLPKSDLGNCSKALLCTVAKMARFLDTPEEKGDKRLILA